jgi:prophage maintenance system killer protein
MLKDKYNMTMEQNVFLAKRNIVDCIWKSANLEGIAVTFPETQKIYDGGNVAHLRIDEIVTINNLKHAWQFILSTITDKIDFNYISSVHSLVGSNVVESPGKLRIYDVTMGGTKWKPKMPNKDELEILLEKCNKGILEHTENISVTDVAITLMCKLMKMQVFNDGNKRTAMLIANKILIENGKGIISVSEDNKEEFGYKLIAYYEDEEKINELKEFIYNNCLDGQG